MQNKLYCLACDANFTPINLFKTPLKWFIKLATWSKINHIADTYSYSGCDKKVNQAVGSGYESINYLTFFKNRNANIYAYEITVPIDFDLWHNDTLKQRGGSYGAVEASYSAVNRSLKAIKLDGVVKKTLKINDKDNDLFCSQAFIKKLKNQGYLKGIRDSNEINPKECIELLLRCGLCRQIKIHVWDGKRILNNIWE